MTAVTEDGEELKLATIYGDETVRKADALLLKCRTCKSKKIVCFDELLGEQGEEDPDCGRFDEVAKLEANDAGGALRILARRALALHPLQRVPQRMSGVLVRKMRV